MGASYRSWELYIQTDTKSPRLTRSWRTTATFANAAVLILAITTLLGWALGISTLTSLLPGATPMFPVTAVALLLGSVACLLLEHGASKWRSIVASILAFAVLAVGLAVLSECLFDLRLNLDQALFRRALEHRTLPNAEYIAPNTALNLALLGAALLLFVGRQEKATRTAQFLTVAAGLIALFALFGYAYGEHYLYQISHFPAMALPAAVAFLLLCTAMLALRPARHGFGIFLGVALLLAVVASTAIVALLATRRLIDSNRRVEHTRVVTEELDGTLTALLSVETSERGYVYTGGSRYLAPYRGGGPEISQHLNGLASLTADNPVQQQNVARLRPLVQDVLVSFQQVVTFETAGQHEAAKELILSGVGETKMEAVRTVLAEMKAEELKLLATRSTETQRSARYLLLTIPASLAFTAILLVLAGLLVKQDVDERVQTTREFRELSEREHEARKQAEMAHQRTESLLSSISETFTVLDKHWKIIYVNSQAVELAGKSRQELLGKDYWLTFPNALGTKLEEAYRRSMETQKGETLESFDESLQKWFSVRLYPSEKALTVFGQDITVMKQAQDALVRSEKLAAVGRMAATIAHEINNPLEAITNLIFLAGQDPSVSENVRGTLALADEELKRVAHITKQTLGFYRDTFAPAMVRMQGVMGSVLDLYSRRFDNRQISVRTEFEDCAVYGYAGELRQLFSNLCANAIDAVQNGGKLRVRISQCRTRRSSNQPGILVTVADDGCGIAPEHQRSLFEPFFTTKNATGTGLGLWVAKKIVEKHGGWVTVRSNSHPARHYTAVSVFLPIRSEALQETLAAGKAG